MQTVQVGEFKARFSEIIEAVRAGETVVVSRVGWVSRRGRRNPTFRRLNVGLRCANPTYVG